MLETATILLTGIMSSIYGSVTGARSDEVTGKIYRKTKELLIEDENTDEELNANIEKSIIEGYYFALYFCVDECRRKAKAASDRSLLIELNNIEGIIDGKQKSDNAYIRRIFSETAGTALFLGGGAKKEDIDDLIYRLLTSTFDKIYLPREYKAEADLNLFEKMRSYFIADIKGDSRLKSFLEKELLSAMKDDFGSNMLQIKETIGEVLKPRYNGVDSSFDTKIQLIKKFGSLFGISPLKEALNIDINKCPQDMQQLYRSWESRKDDNTTGTYSSKRKDDFINAPCIPDENKSEQFIVGDSINGGPNPSRLFFVICRSQTPFSLYPIQVEEIDTDTKKSRIYRTYQVNTSCKIGDYYNIVSVLLYADHALIQTARLKNGGYIDSFADTRSLDYTYGSDNADFGARDLEADVCYSIDNPLKVLTFIDVREKCIVKPKIKYDYQLEAKYGSLTLLRNGIYLVLQLSFAREGENVQALDFYNAMREESASEYVPLQFALIMKNRLYRMYDLFLDRYREDVLRYSRELFCWTTLSSERNQLESEMDNYMSYLSEVIKKEKDNANILGLSDLQACAVYNKALSYKRAGNIEKAITCCEQSVQIIKMIRSVQPDYPLKKDLDFYINALARLKQ